MNAIDRDNEIKDARRLLGLPECNLNSNIHLFSKKISPDGNFLFNPPEEYQLYFLLQGSLDVYYKKGKVDIPGEKLFFLTGTESVHFKSKSECVLVILCFRDIVDTVNRAYLKGLSAIGGNGGTCPVPFFSVSERLGTFVLRMVNDLSGERIYPATLEIIFSFLRAFFTAEQMASLFHELIMDLSYMEEKNKSAVLRHQVAELQT